MKLVTGITLAAAACVLMGCAGGHVLPGVSYGHRTVDDDIAAERRAEEHSARVRAMEREERAERRRERREAMMDEADAILRANGGKAPTLTSFANPPNTRSKSWHAWKVGG